MTLKWDGINKKIAQYTWHNSVSSFGNISEILYAAAGQLQWKKRMMFDVARCAERSVRLFIQTISKLFSSILSFYRSHLHTIKNLPRAAVLAQLKNTRIKLKICPLPAQL